VLLSPPFGQTRSGVLASSVWTDVLALPAAHFTPGRKRYFIEALREAASSISSRLGCDVSGSYFRLGCGLPQEAEACSPQGATAADALADALVSEPRKGPPHAVKRRREAEASSEHVSGEDEDKAGAMAPPELASVDWAAEAAGAGLPRLRELLQAAAAEQRAAARDARRAAADACSASAAAQLAALDSAEAREVAASTRLRQLLTAAERVMARVARRHAAEEALREANEAAAEAASLQAQAEALAAELAEESEGCA